MQLTRIYFDRFTPKDAGVCAEVSITFDDMLCIHKVIIINGKNGLFIGMPHTDQVGNYNEKRRFQDIVHTTNNEFRVEIQDKILEKYHEEMVRRGLEQKS